MKRQNLYRHLTKCKKKVPGKKNPSLLSDKCPDLECTLQQSITNINICGEKYKVISLQSEKKIWLFIPYISIQYSTCSISKGSKTTKGDQ